MGRKSGRGSRLRRAAAGRGKKSRGGGASPTPTPPPEGERGPAAPAVRDVTPAAATSDSESDRGGRGDRRTCARPPAAAAAGLSLSPSPLPSPSPGAKVKEPTKEEGDAPKAVNGAASAKPPAPREPGRDVGLATPPPAAGQLDKFRAELDAMVAACALTDAEAAARDAAVAAVEKAVAAAGLAAGAAATPFGSTATRTATHASDVDIEITGVAAPGPGGGFEGGARDDAVAALEAVAARLKASTDPSFATVELVRGARVPLVRATTAGDAGVAVDISLSDGRGAAAAAALSVALAAAPALHGALIALKALLRQAGLDDVHRGGLGSHCLALMARAHVADPAPPPAAAADAFLSFLQRYGALDAAATAVSSDGAFVPRPSLAAAAPPPAGERRLAVVDPVSGRDVGGAVSRLRALQSAFRRAARGLASALAGEGPVLAAAVDASAAARRAPAGGRRAASPPVAVGAKLPPPALGADPPASFNALAREASAPLAAAVRRGRLAPTALDARALAALAALPPRAQGAAVADLLNFAGGATQGVRNPSAVLMKAVGAAAARGGGGPPPQPRPPGPTICADAGALLDRATAAGRLRPGALAPRALDALAFLPPALQAAAAADLAAAPPHVLARDGPSRVLEDAVAFHAGAVGLPKPPPLAEPKKKKSHARSRSRSRARDRRRRRSPSRSRSRSRDRRRRRRRSRSRSRSRSPRRAPGPPPGFIPAPGFAPPPPPPAIAQIEALEARGALPMRCLDPQAVAALGAAPPPVAAAAVADLAAAARAGPLRNASAYLCKALATARARMQ